MTSIQGNMSAETSSILPTRLRPRKPPATDWETLGAYGSLHVTYTEEAKQIRRKLSKPMPSAILFPWTLKYQTWVWDIELEYDVSEFRRAKMVDGVPKILTTWRPAEVNVNQLPEAFAKRLQVLCTDDEWDNFGKNSRLWHGEKHAFRPHRVIVEAEGVKVAGFWKKTYVGIEEVSDELLNKACAIILRDLGEPGWEQCVRIWTKTFGPSHSMSAVLRANLEREPEENMEEMGIEEEEAEKWLEEVMMIEEKVRLEAEMDCEDDEFLSDF
ncbi:hypothetical protein V2G26_017298 [Clonostachys chloroleuca]